MNLTFNDILKINYESLINFNNVEKFQINGIVTDSRLVKSGQLFVAIKGKNIDGHKFIEEAVKNGASGFIVNKSYHSKNSIKFAEKIFDGLPIIIVTDTIKALGEIASIYRNKFNIPVIAVAGSNGKTTTKDMIAAVLNTKYNVLSTEANFNNDIGVPLTLFRMNKNHDIAVVEIGTNHFGEIKYLCNILQPTHGIITNIGNEHLEFLMNINGVLKEEGALFEYLRSRKNIGTAFINTDDKRVLSISKRIKNKILFGVDKRSLNYSVEKLNLEKSGLYSFEIKNKGSKKNLKINLSVPGRHNISNALNAAVIGLYFDVPRLKIKKSLELFKASDKRMELLNKNGVLILNDSYNANLDSSISALETLKSIYNEGKKIIVFGDMLELGKHTKRHHQLVGKAISNLSKDVNNKVYLYTYGKQAKYINREADTDYKCHYDDKKKMSRDLLKIAVKGDAILIKGSRGMKMEEVIEQFIKG